jgi:DNA repair protein RecO (recombination protein O)
MLKKTSGIVVSYIRYRESSIVVKIFTRDLGLKSYVVNGVRSSTSKSKMAFYQPLTILEMVVYDKEGAGLNRVSEVKLAVPFHRIPFDFHRSGVAMFVGEVLGKSIYDNYQNESLFDFLQYAISHLDSEEVQLPVFPIVFLWETSRYLGFAPMDAASFFNEIDQEVNTSEFIGQEMSYLDQLIQQSFGCQLKIPAEFRRSLLDHFLLFYTQHLENSTEWKSVKVLRQVIF